MNRTLLPLLLMTLLLSGAGCDDRPSVQPTVSTTTTLPVATTDAVPSTNWINFHSDALKFSVSYPPSLAPDMTDDRSAAFSEVESGYGTYGVTAFATTAGDTAAWVAAQTEKLTPFLLIRSDYPDQILEVVTHLVETDSDHGRPVYSTELKAVEVSNGMAYTITWRNQTPAGTLPTLMDADTLKFLRSFVVDVPPVSPDDQAWHDANTALAQFLGLLHERTYAAAGGRFGGELDELRYWNPMVAENDIATLWKNGCEMNGLQCMAVASITPASHSARAFTFDVTFTTDDGAIYAKDGKTAFPFVVRAESDGLYFVVTMPLYQE